MTDIVEYWNAEHHTDADDAPVIASIEYRAKTNWSRTIIMWVDNAEIIMGKDIRTTSLIRISPLCIRLHLQIIFQYHGILAVYLCTFFQIITDPKIHGEHHTDTLLFLHDFFTSFIKRGYYHRIILFIVYNELCFSS
jgi:hypothetical protein